MRNNDAVLIARLCRAAMAVMLVALAVRASDASAVSVIGFSPDGRMMAFERYGTHDGSAFPFCDVFFVNVDSNSYASKPVRVRVDSAMAEDTARVQALKQSRTTLERLKIVRGDSGVAVAFDERARTDSSETFTLAGKKWRLVLSIRAAADPCGDDYGGAKIFTLSAQCGSSTIVLQNDTGLPKSRGCALSYSIEYARMKGDRIAVFVRYSTPGYEGPDSRQIVVTGRLVAK